MPANQKYCQLLLKTDGVFIRPIAGQGGYVHLYPVSCVLMHPVLASVHFNR